MDLLSRRNMLMRGGNAIDWETLYKAALDKQFASGQLVIPDGVTAIKGSQFNQCAGFTGELVIPSSVTSFGTYAFNGCSGLTSIIIRAEVTTIPTWCFAACNSALYVDLPSTLTTASNAYALRIPACETLICRAAVPPTLSATSFQVGATCAIYVPDASVAAYKSADYWSAFASRIYPISELNE